MRSRWIMSLVSVIVLAGIVGCSSAPAEAPKPAQPAEAPKAAQPAEAPKPQVVHLAIGTGGAGGTFYYVGGAMAQVINKYVKGVNAVAEASTTVAQNIKMVQAKEQSIALAQPEGVYVAYKGLPNDWGLPQCSDIRLVCAGHDQVLQVVALAKSGITKMSQVKGKRVAVGSAASKPIAMQLLKFHGVEEKDMQVRFLPLAEQTSALKDGTIDVGTYHSGLPIAAIIELAATEKVNYIPIEAQAMSELQKVHPYWWSSVLPAGTYKGQDKDVPTLGSGSCVIVHKDVPEDLVYEMVKSFMEHNDEMVAVHAACKYYTLEQTKKYVERGVFGDVPFHPGAVRYYREKGIIS